MLLPTMASSLSTITVGPSSSIAISSAWSSNPALIGSSWMFSSIVFSTYYTTLFLKHGPKEKGSDFEQRSQDVMLGNDNSVAIQGPKRKPLATLTNNVLENMSRPQLLTLFRFSGSLLLGIFAHPDFFAFRKRIMTTLQFAGDFAIPAVFLFVANFCNSLALDKIGISLTYTSKCLIPLITVLLTVMVDGISALPSHLALLMLIPIASGVAMASWNSPTFEKRGFLAAIISSTAQAALNVSSKRALLKTGISGLEAQRSMVSVAFVVAICMIIQSNMKRNNIEKKALPPSWLSIAAAASYHFEYVLSFLFLKMVHPIGYGTCDAIRRLGIIVAGRQMFGGEPFSALNYGGIGLALLGALGYSIAGAKK